MTSMRLRSVVGAVLVLALSACSSLMPLASATAESGHSCCPSSERPERHDDCCLRATVSPAATLAAPDFLVIALAAPQPAPVAGRAGLAGCAADPPSPGGPPSAVLPSRAPPTVPA